ncbi:MAG: hypothetical protein ACE5D3_00255 [Candidatus Binatia bacterium]
MTREIAGAQEKLRATYDKACGGLSPGKLAKLHLCGNNPAAIKSCVVSGGSDGCGCRADDRG